MNFRGNALVPDNKNSGESWDTESMIWIAKSLQRVAKELDRDGESPESDPLLFSGKFVAGPVFYHRRRIFHRETRLWGAGQWNRETAPSFNC